MIHPIISKFKPITCCVCFVFFMITLAGCDRTVPSPGTVTVGQSSLSKKQTGAAGSLLGKTLYLTVDQAKGDYQKLAGKRLVATFILGYQYQLYQHKRVNFLISKGTYKYAVDAYHVNQSQLNMSGKRGLNFVFTFNTIRSGSFSARSNDTSVKGSLQGHFVLKLNQALS